MNFIETIVLLISIVYMINLIKSYVEDSVKGKSKNDELDHQMKHLLAMSRAFQDYKKEIEEEEKAEKQS